MSQWPERRLGDVIEAKYGKALPKAKRSGGDVAVFGSNGVVGFHDVAITKGPTIVIGRKGSVGEVAFSSTPCWPIDTTYYVDEFGPYSVEFLDQLLRSLGLQQLDRSTAIPGLSRDQLYDLRVPVPPSDEQRAVVATAKQLEERRARSLGHVHAGRRALNKFRRAVLRSASAGEVGTTTDAEWPRVRLGDVADRVTKGTTPTSYGHAYTTSGVAFIKVENLRDGLIDRSSITAFISEETNRAQARSILQEGDVLFSIAGTIGRTAVVRREDLPANTNQALAIIRGVSDTFDPNYLSVALQGAVQEVAAGAARGSGMNNISLADVRDFELAVPPIAEQTRIAATVESLLADTDAVERRLASVEQRVNQTSRTTMLRTLGLDRGNDAGARAA